MAFSPKRPDPLRDAEARVRALTREVGTLREDLRREVKKRERAVAQAKENEEARRESEARAQQLAYSNRKLATELDTLHEAARTASERDRRALRSLREGLAAVEEAVAGRARKGYTQIRQLQETHQQLRQLLFGSPAASDPLLANIAGLSAAAAPRAEQLLSAAQTHAAQLEGLLSGVVEGVGGSSGGGGGGDGVAGDADTGSAGEREPGGAALALAAAAEEERDRLRAEVEHLRVELRAMAEKAAAAAPSATALELQHSLREAHGELARLRGEVVHLNAAAATTAREQQGMVAALEEARIRLQQQDELHAALVTSVRQQEDSSLGLVAEVTARNVELQGQVSSLAQQFGALQQQVSELLEERRALEAMLEQREQELRATKASMLEQGADIRSALSLISRQPAAAAAPSATTATQAPVPDRPTLLAQSISLPIPVVPTVAAAGPAASHPSLAPSASLDQALAAALAPYHNASAAIGSALAAAAAILPLGASQQQQQQPQSQPPSAGIPTASAGLSITKAAPQVGAVLTGVVAPPTTAGAGAAGSWAKSASASAPAVPALPLALPAPPVPTSQPLSQPPQSAAFPGHQQHLLSPRRALGGVRSSAHQQALADLTAALSQFPGAARSGARQWAASSDGAGPIAAGAASSGGLSGTNQRSSAGAGLSAHGINPPLINAAAAAAAPFAAMAAPAEASSRPVLGVAAAGGVGLKAGMGGGRQAGSSALGDLGASLAEGQQWRAKPGQTWSDPGPRPGRGPLCDCGGAAEGGDGGNAFHSGSWQGGRRQPGALPGAGSGLAPPPATVGEARDVGPSGSCGSVTAGGFSGGAGGGRNGKAAGEHECGPAWPPHGPSGRRQVVGEGLLVHALHGRERGGGPTGAASGDWADVQERGQRGQGAGRGAGTGAGAGGGGGAGAGTGSGSRLAALRRDMRSLDEEIAEMEASLAVAAKRTL